MKNKPKVFNIKPSKRNIIKFMKEQDSSYECVWTLNDAIDSLRRYKKLQSPGYRIILSRVIREMSITKSDMSKDFKLKTEVLDYLFSLYKEK